MCWWDRCTPTHCRDFFHRFNFTFKAFLNLPYRVKAMTAVAAAGKGRVDAVKVARAQESRVLYVMIYSCRTGQTWMCIWVCHVCWSILVLFRVCLICVLRYMELIVTFLNAGETDAALAEVLVNCTADCFVCIGRERQRDRERERERERERDCTSSSVDSVVPMALCKCTVYAPLC